MSTRSRQDILKQYNIPYWSDGYIDVDDQGEVVIKPHRHKDNIAINLPSLVDELQQQNLALPVLVRFSEILHDRVNSLCDAFNQVCEQQNYQGSYTAVYPIKVNQQRRVVEEILDAQPAAQNGQVGLEAGSKPELLAVLALSPRPNSIIICNGYKDREYIRLALMGNKIGRRVYIVIEKASELTIILDEAKKLGVKPQLGIRARLASIGKGNWQNTGGEKAKFGLSASQILEVVNTLNQHNALTCLELLHFHLGSQIGNIRDIQTGLKECARFYSQLRTLGAPVNMVDIGGGLGIDYEGTRSRSACSINYSVAEYAYNVITTLREECDRSGAPHPNVISESGRAMTAHHAVLITNIIDVESINPGQPKAPLGSSPSILQTLWKDYQHLQNQDSTRSIVEIYHDVAHAIGEVHSLFAHGLLSLQQRAHAEQIYQASCLLVRSALSPEVRAHREALDELNEKLADKVFINLSLFQSLPDIWGIDQIFPILPLSQLNDAEGRRAVLQDITCDSDGRIDHYVDEQGIETTIPLPRYQAENPYLLGFFLTGAYQEILGDMHNLFGDTNSVDVTMDEEGVYQIEHPIAGDTVEQVLRYVKYEADSLLASFQANLDQAELSQQDRAMLLEEVAAGLKGYTYLE
ncbi:MAG: biosynthetic arginine decarboxylase [Pseudomonadales bacterium]|nr:biosynthetic arginine decarboxylase [Pseudomonadales bacterium]